VEVHTERVYVSIAHLLCGAIEALQVIVLPLLRCEHVDHCVPKVEHLPLAPVQEARIEFVV